jgi:hypothetical protein
VRPAKHLRDVSPQALSRHHQRPSVTRREALDPVLSLLDVALEALREAWHEQRMSGDDIWRYAKLCRVVNVMRPYLDSLT